MPLHRPYIRQEVRAEVERRAEKNENGQFLDANTHKPIEGQYDLGHKAGHEHWREAEQAEKAGLTQEEFNDRMNNPNLYQIEAPMRTDLIPMKCLLIKRKSIAALKCKRSQIQKGENQWIETVS